MVDQEEARLENSEAILRNLVSEFKAQGIKIKVVDEDTIAYKGIQFDLLDSPTDTLNGVIYLESPSRQVIPIREENLGEGVESIMQYVESQKENPLRKWKKVKMSKNIRGHLDDADQIRQPIRDWYTSTYPDDDLGMNLSDITFRDLHTGISQGLDVYDHIGVGDSIVRERLFDRLAELKSISYDAIYDMWLNGMRKGMRKSSIVNTLSASISNFTLNGEPVNVFLTNDGVYVGLRSNYDNHGHYDNSDGSLLYVSSLESVFHALFGSGWADTYEEMAESFNTFASPEEVNRVRDYLARLGYQEQRIQTFGDGKGWDDYRASAKKSKKLSKNMRKSMPNSRLVDKVAQIIERELPNVSFVGDSMGYEPDIYDWVEGYIYETNQNVDEPWVDVESAEDLAEMILDSINGSYDSTVQTPNGDSIRMISKKLSKNSINALADRIAMDCQCDSAEVHNLNGEDILMMPVMDSDCEDYYEEYDIYQEEMDGVTYNCVNLSRMNKGVRKHTMLSKNESIPSFSQMMKSVKDGSPIGLFRERF